MSKALIHELGKSKSFGRLSWKGKILWPMLLTTSDDQGRGQADPDVIKWYVCPNVAEIAQEDIPTLLEEMQTQGMIILYGDPGEQLYQVVNWWEYQKMQWAHPSKYDPPEGWTDRLRYNVRGGGYFEENWKDETSPVNAQEVAHVEQPLDLPPGNPPRNPPGLPTKLNLQLNSTELTTEPNLTAQDILAVPEKIREIQALTIDAIKKKKLKASEWEQLLAFEESQKKPRKGLVDFINRKLANGNLSPEQSQYLALFGATRFSNPTQARTVQETITAHGLPLVIEVGTWAANSDIPLGKAISGLKKTAAKWNSNPGQQPQQQERRQKTEEPLDVRIQREEIRRQLGRSD